MSTGKKHDRSIDTEKACFQQAKNTGLLYLTNGIYKNANS